MTNNVSRDSSRFRQRGSITSMVLAWWALTVLSIVAIATTGTELLLRQRTQHAADAVALAWVSRGYDAGTVVAISYNAVVTRVEDEGQRVRIWVQLGDHTASATAQYTH